jgi:hypothetical protein
LLPSTSMQKLLPSTSTNVCYQVGQNTKSSALQKHKHCIRDLVSGETFLKKGVIK